MISPRAAEFTLDPKVEYTATAVTSDNSYVTTSVKFTLTELPALTADQVMISSTTEDGSPGPPAVVSLGKFLADGKAACDT